MLTKEQAISAAIQNVPDGHIKKVIELDDRFVFQIFRNDPLEGDLDPFYHIYKISGEFSDFSLISDKDIDVIVRLLQEAKEA